MSNTRVNFGVIGAGGIARRRTIPGMLKTKNCRLVAVMNPSDPERIAEEFKVPRAYRREEDLLAELCQQSEGTIKEIVRTKLRVTLSQTASHLN